MSKNNDFLNHEMAFSHFIMLNLFFHRLSIFSKWVRHVEKELPKTEKSSINTSIVFSIMSWKIAIIHLWNVPGALQRPEGKPPVCERVPYGASEICLFPDHLGRWGFGNNPRNHRENNSIHSPQASRAFGPNEMVKWKVCYSGGFIQHSVVPMHTAILYPIELGINSFCSFSTTVNHFLGTHVLGLTQGLSEIG
ncbi:hypothetical protein Tco_1437505 [Tanacetum coccineum]